MSILAMILNQLIGMRKKKEWTKLISVQFRDEHKISNGNGGIFSFLNINFACRREEDTAVTVVLVTLRQCSLLSPMNNTCWIDAPPWPVVHAHSHDNVIDIVYWGPPISPRCHSHWQSVPINHIRGPANSEHKQQKLKYTISLDRMAVEFSKGYPELTSEQEFPWNEIRFGFEI